MAVVCFVKHCFSTQTALLFVPENLQWKQLFLGVAQTHEPLKRLDLNFIIVKILRWQTIIYQYYPNIKTKPE